MKKHIILIFVSVLIALILCGVSSAADSTDETQNSTISGADPIINGTVYINESGHVRVLPNATVTVNSSTNKNLATTKTDQNGYYSLIFYSTATQFNVTATYTSSNPVTNIVTVTLNPDGNYYGTGNFTLTPIPAQVTSVGAYSDDIWVQEKNSYNYAGLINVQSPPTTGTVYSSYCIDLYTDISINDYLYVNGPFPGTTGNFSDNGIDWGKVNYIINHYTASNDTEAAAIQAAIWYFTSAHYGVYPGNDTSHPGYYQYMTYNSTYGTPYDGYSTTYGGTIAQRAWQIINSATTLLYPSTVTVSPVITTAHNGDNVTVIATVKDQFGNPLQNVTVNFTRTSGNLSVSSGLTNSSGQISTILSGVTSNSTSNVIATVTGNYGTLLYDDQYNQGNRTQNLAFISLSPYALAATSEINYAIQANVTIAKTVNGASSATVNVGDLLTFIITATCTGANNATGIMINETLPQGFVPTSIIASNGTYINGIWTIPLLRTGTSATLTIIGNATAAMAGKTLNNTAVRFFQVENNPQPSTATTPVYTKEADVAINKTVNGVKSAILNVGDVITYLITATNNGPDNATGLQIKDLLPSGFIFQSANTYGSGTYNNVTGIWDIGNLVNGATATLNITGIVNSTWAGLNTTNYANRTAQTEYNGLSNTTNATIYTLPPGANVQINKTVNGVKSTTVNVGDTINFIITATNYGPLSATGLQITDLLPAGLSNVSYSASGGTTYNNATGLWNIGTLLKDNTVILNITGIVTSTWAGFNLTNYANITALNQNSTFSKTTNASVYTKKANVTINKTVNSVKNLTVNVGATVTYIITAVNNGPDTATGLQITDLLLTGLSNIVCTATVGTTYDLITGIWNIGSLLNGANATLNITGIVTSLYAGLNVTNYANRTAQNEYNNQSSTTNSTLYTKKVDIQLTKTTNVPAVPVNTNIIFIISAKNYGPDNATNVRITDILPANVTYQSSSATLGTYNRTTGIWSIPTLNNGVTAYLNITVRPTVTYTWYTNFVNQTSQTEYDAVNNTANATFYAYTNRADIVLNKTANTVKNAIVNVGDTVTFVITAHNNGPQRANSLQITDLLPAGYNYISYSASTGTYSNITGIWNINRLNNGATATLTITGRATAAWAGLNTTNYANITSLTEYSALSNTTNATAYTKKADVVLSKTGSYSGKTVTFIVTATNNGPDTATNINVRDLIPAGLTIIQIIVLQGTYNNSTGIWNIGSLSNGSVASMAIIGNATPQSTINNTATWLNQTEYNSHPNNATASVYVPLVDLVSYNYPWYGYDGIPYYDYVVGNAPVITFTIENNGPDDASGVVYNYVLGPGLQYDGCSVPQGTVTYNSATNTLTWNVGYISSGNNVTMNLIVRMMQSGYQTANLTGTARLINVDQFDGNNTQDNSTCALIGYASADIAVNKAQTYYTDSGFQYLKYTITVTNNGPDDATYVKVTDMLPSSVVWISDTGAGTYNHITGIWNIGSINNGMYKVLNITTRIIDASQPIRNTVDFNPIHSAQYDPDWANNAMTTTYGNYTPSYELEIFNFPWWWDETTETSKYDYNVGDVAVITVDVANSCPDDANNVVIEYDLGSGLEYMGNVPDQGTVTFYSSENKLIWNAGYLANGYDVALKIFVRILESGYETPNLSGTAIEVGNSTNRAICALIGIPGADIAVNQTQEVYTDNGTTYVRYTINVINNGPDTATNVQVTDLLPTGLVYVSSSVPSGTTYNSTTGIWNIGTLSDGVAKTLTITSRVTISGTFKNIAAKTREMEEDPNPANDAQTLVFIKN